MREDRRQAGGGDTHEDSRPTLHVQLSLRSGSRPASSVVTPPGLGREPSWSPGRGEPPSLRTKLGQGVGGGRFCTNCRPPSTGNRE